MNSTLDLRQLAIQRDAPAAATPRRRHWLTRYVLPGGILLGFAALALWSLRESFMSAQPVTVMPVVTTRAETQQAGTPLFQSAGWVEPRPTPTLVAALAEGVVDKLLVVENQHVKAGVPVALLVDIDAKIGLNAAEADLELRKAEVESARATLTSASTNFEKPLHLQVALAEAEAMLSRAELELANLPQQVRSAEARQLVAQQDYDGKKRSVMSGAIAEITLQQAKRELDAAAAAVNELRGREPRLKREAEAQKLRRDALEQRLQLKTDERRQLEEANAGLKAAQARLAQAQAALDAAQLRLTRMVIRAPITGRVLSLVARPGMRLMGLAPGALQDSSTVVTLYDPAQLQVRADVRFEDLPRVQPGQPVRIDSPAIPGGSVAGEVLFSTSLADIQKNTLQVKVAIPDPPPLLRPDMLVQVTFLAPPSEHAPGQTDERLRVMIPRQLVESSDASAHVWVADLAGRAARRRSVKLGAASGPELVEVVEGLTPADKLIVSGREGLRDGQRIAVTGEDTSLGAAAVPQGTRGGLPSRLAPQNPQQDHKAR
jgi:RND family efflux transporter MFP subunit